MSMLDITREELNKHSALAPQLNSTIEQVTKSIPFETVPTPMKAVIAVSQMTAYASQFRRNILLWDDDTEVPVNAISFVICGSGTRKDSSNNAVRKCFRTGYEMLDKYVKSQVTRNAINAAREAGEDLPEEFDVYKAYLKSIPPIDITPTTGPGLIKHISDIAQLDALSGLLYTGEVSDELANNPSMVENIKTLSELYDLGKIGATYTKGVEHRTGSVDGQPVSALMMGSPGYLLYDESVKRKFEVAFMSKLARRSWFCYTPDEIPEPDFSDAEDPITAFDEYGENLELAAKQSRVSTDAEMANVAEYNIKRIGRPLSVSKEVTRLYKVYQRYNNELANTYLNQDSTYCLIRRHLQWKALKLAGTFTILNCRDEITLEDYIEATRFCELLDGHMNRFEADLNKSYYERFADYAHTQITEAGKAVISIHDIKKHGFMSSIALPKLKELVTLCAGYDTEGLYTIVNDGSAIQYEPIIKTDVIGISFKPIDTTALNAATESGDANAISKAKQDIAVTTSYGYEVADTTFAELGELLHHDYAYSPFRFRNGSRGRDNIIGSTKWLVFDIDNSPLTMSEVHFMLSGINHHIALSSNPDNEYKFRLLVELDSPVDVPQKSWKHFYAAVANELAISVDPLPQSQIFFSYAGRPVLSQLEAEPFAVRDCLMQALDVQSATTETISTSKARSLLADPQDTFDFAYNCEMGSGSRSMIRAMYYAKDLGATLDQALELLHDINDFWFAPMPEERFNNLILQVERIYHG